jgi:hypothetical protein
VNQRSLFDPEPPAQRHSPTSVEAAAQIAPRAGTLRSVVLRALAAAGADGMTDEELQDRLAMGPSTQRPRRVELVQAGLVRDSGRTRSTRSGRQAVVWVAGESTGGAQ